MTERDQFDLHHGSRMNMRLSAITRTAVCALGVILQIALTFLITWRLRQHAAYLYTAFELLGIVAAILMVSQEKNASYKMAWVLFVLLMPVFGLILYLMWGHSFEHPRRDRPMRQAFQAGYAQLSQDEEALNRFIGKHPYRLRTARLLMHYNFPLYDQTGSEYFPVGEVQFERMKQDLRQARKFIFMEYFIIGENRVWAEIHEILRERAAHGVEVRVLYDDAGSLFTLKDGFIQRLTAEGIQCQVFGPVQRYVANLYFNYRNHQKICVIDGDVAYTGGTNLDDEYANLYPKHGHWKDTAVRLSGLGVWSLTVFFLQMWDSTREKVTGDYALYRPTRPARSDGFVQPLSDGPANNPGNPGQALYNQMIHDAGRYIYMTTPYLVIDDTMVDALCRAAESGVDVRIVTPGQYDHWYVYPVTRSYYGQLIRSGVRIYEYTPGFIHAKMVVSDDDQALVGTFNMDYRSFYLHFEDAVWFCGGSMVDKVKDDVLKIFEVSHEVTLPEVNGRPLYYKAMAAVFRLFAPMM